MLSSLYQIVAASTRTGGMQMEAAWLCDVVIERPRTNLMSSPHRGSRQLGFALGKGRKVPTSTP